MIEEVTFIDVETTGLYVSEDRIVQISLRKGNNSFTSLVNPGMPVSPGAFEVHGLNDEVLSTAPKFKDILESIIPFIDGDGVKYLCGYNVSFDFKFLQAELSRCNLLVESNEYRFIDPFLIHKKLNPRDLASMYKLYTGKEYTDAHNSERDVEACKEILEIQQISNNTDIANLSELTGLKDYTIGGWLKISDSGYIVIKGKHVGLSLEAIVNSDPGYLVWLTSLPDLSIEEHLILKEYIL